MRLKAIYEQLDEISPFELQASWDNSGLIIGDFEQEISQIVVSIDIDEALIAEVQEGTLIITHHPLIFSGIKSMDFGTYPSKLLAQMMAKNIANIAMHTNFDLSHLNRYVVEKVLSQRVIEEAPYLLYFEVKTTMQAYVEVLKSAFNLEQTKAVIAHDREIRRVALCTGSGASMIKDVKADLFLTGDIKYHDAMEAKSMGLNMLDIGHYESERFFGEILAADLKILGLPVIISSSENPFTYL